MEPERPKSYSETPEVVSLSILSLRGTEDAGQRRNPSSVGRLEPVDVGDRARENEGEHALRTAVGDVVVPCHARVANCTGGDEGVVSGVMLKEVEDPRTL